TPEWTAVSWRAFGEGQELDVIAGVIIGGTSLFGGRGTVVGTLFGALLMGVLRNGLTLLDIASVWQKIVIGCVIVVAVLLDYYRRKLT
ncbi:MAG TPA: ribose ABC transporter permease, partial [bacterium]|nr:ribose ABC transporter permease [bacterium]